MLRAAPARAGKGVWNAGYARLSGLFECGSDAVGDYAVCCEVAPSDYVSRSCSGYGNAAAVMEEAVPVAVGYKF